MINISMKEIETEYELKEVLNFCYHILGDVTEATEELYGYDAWHNRFLEKVHPLVCAMNDGKIVSAILGRAENSKSVIVGYAACHKDYRKQGITKELLKYFERLTQAKGYQSISLSSNADGFYEKCGYKRIFQVHGQNIYQKIL